MFSADSSLSEYQELVKKVYGFNNDRFFGQRDMLTNLERFIMRALKGIRKEDKEKTKINLIIALGWFISFMNRLHIDIEQEVWQRFPGKCSYCASSPCKCGELRPQSRQELSINDSDRPKSLKSFQDMFQTIYPAEMRTLEKAGIHLAEEMGELSESILVYGGSGRAAEEFQNVKLEAADLFSCFIAVFNSLDVNLVENLNVHFSNESCHACHRPVCECSFDSIMNYPS